MKKIAVDCSKLSTRFKTGTHRFLIGFLNELVKRDGYEFYFYFNEFNPEVDNYEFLKIGNLVELGGGYYTQISLLKELNKYDYFVFPWQTAPFFGFLSGSKNVIAIIHDSGYSFKTKLFTFLTQIFSNKLYSVSESTSKDLFKVSFVLNEGVDSSIFYKIPLKELQTLQKEYQVPDKFILSVGRIEERKNIFNNLEAFKFVSKLYPNLKYCFIGSFSINEELIYSYIDKLGIDRSQIIFKNYVSDRELNIYLNSCEFVVFTSQNEGFGLPVLEAYKVGKWVILSKIQQLAELSLSANQLVDQNNPRKIAEKMVYFLNNKSELKKIFKPNNILVKYSWKNCVDRFLEGLEDEK